MLIFRYMIAPGIFNYLHWNVLHMHWNCTELQINITWPWFCSIISWHAFLSPVYYAVWCLVLSYNCTFCSVQNRGIGTARYILHGILIVTLIQVPFSLTNRTLYLSPAAIVTSLAVIMLRGSGCINHNSPHNSMQFPLFSVTLVWFNTKDLYTITFFCCSANGILSCL